MNMAIDPVSPVHAGGFAQALSPLASRTFVNCARKGITIRAKTGSASCTAC